MRHKNRRGKLGVKSQHRIALLRNLTRSLVLHKRIETTVVKAKQASAFSDKLVEIGKRGDLHARRLLISKLGCADTADALIKIIAPRFKDRKGGYTRVLKLSNRPGDGAQKAILEFTEIFEAPESKTKKDKTKTAKKPSAKKTTAVEEAPKKAPAKEVSEEKAEEKTEGKKGGFLGTLRKFLKSDES